MADTDNPTTGDQEPTQKLSPFETMVLSRFDDLTMTLARFEHDTNIRLDKLEARTYDTKPIWERALAEILEVKGEITGMKGKISEIEAHLHDIDHTLVGMYSTLIKFDERIAALESVKR